MLLLLYIMEIKNVQDDMQISLIILHYRLKPLHDNSQPSWKLFIKKYDFSKN